MRPHRPESDIFPLRLPAWQGVVCPRSRAQQQPVRPPPRRYPSDYPSLQWALGSRSFRVLPVHAQNVLAHVSAVVWKNGQGRSASRPAGIIQCLLLMFAIFLA